MSSESSTQRQSLMEIESTCAACGRTLESDSPRVRRCQKCLVAGYCNDECQARGSGTHEPECPSVALEGFKRNVESITGARFCRPDSGVQSGFCMPFLVSESYVVPCDYPIRGWGPRDAVNSCGNVDETGGGVRDAARQAAARSDGEKGKVEVIRIGQALRCCDLYHHACRTTFQMTVRVY